LLDAFACFELTRPGCRRALLEVALVLVGVAVGEVGEGPVERITVAQVLGDRDRVA